MADAPDKAVYGAIYGVSYETLFRGKVVPLTKKAIFVETINLGVFVVCTTLKVN